MHDKGRIALSSLAISTSVAAFLGISAAAHADPPTGYCNVGPACSLGWTADQGSWYGGVIVWTEGEGWGYDPNTIEAGGPATFSESQGHWDYGTCGFNSSSPPSCGCGGWKQTEMYTGQPLWFNHVPGYGDPWNEGAGYSPGYFVPVWDPPYWGVDWSYAGTVDVPAFYPVGTGPTGSYECWIP